MYFEQTKSIRIVLEINFKIKFLFAGVRNESELMLAIFDSISKKMPGKYIKLICLSLREMYLVVLLAACRRSD
ncbi:hypothetical protein SAMN05192553_106161 [Cyclobacterium xiamenense]|uniref:Uncharacterized protein n=1 Tax=Cyclobacterium xiamenense TaxID=1297121 RepID=A0A1H7AAH4_9BACT|nr:hypothetical protein SAMN05192553_106161 [Cyclobacterium xiamenense]